MQRFLSQNRVEEAGQIVRLSAVQSRSSSPPPPLLKLLPGLRLDTLTVLGSKFPGVSQGMIDYDALRDLVHYGNGWKELQYITKDSTMLGNEDLLRRDGAESKATVTIYRATKGNMPREDFSDNNSRILYQKVVPPDTLETFGIEEDLQLMSPDEVGKGLLVVVKRGCGADVAEREIHSFHHRDIRQWSHDMTWQQIKSKHIEIYEESDDY
ncbi:hypothetical protein BDZ45DRAFT_741676 [Acephala macrosclerotiorum]|nr:hypothetical protein BDZ45DRAFT_741676 [Acephala macrosclerotiorum]